MLRRDVVLLAIALGAGCGAPQQSPAPAATDAVEELKRGCVQGMGSQCLEVGRRYQEGDRVAADLAQAVRFYELGCFASDAPSCHAAGQAYLIGAGVTRDVDRAVPFLKKACDADDIHGCYKLGAVYSGAPPFGGTVTDHAASFGFFAKACRLGDPGGCYRAGSAAATGRHGGPPDAVQAAGLYRTSCQSAGVPESVTSSGQASGCWRLAMLYESGRVKAQGDFARRLARAAKEYLSRQCTAGSPADCFALGTMESSDEDPTGDLDRALAAYDRACALGVPPACEQAKALAE